jgi:hypothetical protein
MSYKAPLATTTSPGIVTVGSGLSVTSGTVSKIPSWYGYFSDSTLQTNPVINTANNTTFNTIESSNGISIVGGSQITFANTGVYTITMTVQISKTDGGTDPASIWLSQNGVNVPNSNIELTLVDTGGNTGYRTGIFLIVAVAGDFVQIKWSSPDIAMRFLATAAQVTPTRPATPSVKIVVTQT